LNLKLKDSFSRTNNYHFHAVLMQASYSCVLPPPEARRSWCIQCTSHGFW